MSTKTTELVALKAMLKYIEFEVVSKCCPVCGGNGYHDSACVLAAFLYPEKAESYKHHTHDSHINEMLFKVENDKRFAFLVEELYQVPGYLRAEHRTDEEQGEYNVLPLIGEEDPTFCISDDGAEFLAAIGALEDGENPQPSYLGWTMGSTSERNWFIGMKDEWTISCKSARDLITAIFTLETNGVTDPEPDEVGQ